MQTCSGENPADADAAGSQAARKEQVKKKAKESIMDMLAKTKINANRDNRGALGNGGADRPYKGTGYGVVTASDFLRKPGALFSVWR